jgi:phage-related protein
MTARYTLVFYREASGREPMASFLENLEPHKRAALLAALRGILAEQGLGVCATEYGKHLGKGLAEFRLRHTYDEVTRRFPDREVATPPTRERAGRLLLRVFFHAYGDRRVLLLGGYDKGRRSSRKKQEAEIARARKRLRDFKDQRPQQQTSYREGPAC